MPYFCYLPVSVFPESKHGYVSWPSGRAYLLGAPRRLPGNGSNYVVAEGLAASLDRPLEWAVGFFFGNVELSLELRNIISGISGFDD